MKPKSCGQFESHIGDAVTSRRKKDELSRFRTGTIEVRHLDRRLQLKKKKITCTCINECECSISSIISADFCGIRGPVGASPTRRQRGRGTTVRKRQGNPAAVLNSSDATGGPKCESQPATMTATETGEAGNENSRHRMAGCWGLAYPCAADTRLGLAE